MRRTADRRCLPAEAEVSGAARGSLRGPTIGIAAASDVAAAPLATMEAAATTTTTPIINTNSTTTTTAPAAGTAAGRGWNQAVPCRRPHPRRPRRATRSSISSTSTTTASRSRPRRWRPPAESRRPRPAQGRPRPARGRILSVLSRRPSLRCRFTTLVRAGSGVLPEVRPPFEERRFTAADLAVLQLATGCPTSSLRTLASILGVAVDTIMLTIRTTTDTSAIIRWTAEVAKMSSSKRGRQFLLNNLE